MASSILKEYRELTPAQQDTLDRQGGPFIVVHPTGFWKFDYWSEATEFAGDFLMDMCDGNKSRAHVVHTSDYGPIEGLFY